LSGIFGKLRNLPQAPETKKGHYIEEEKIKFMQTTDSEFCFSPERLLVKMDSPRESKWCKADQPSKSVRIPPMAFSERGLRQTPPFVVGPLCV
jgi:hypothetical protein